MSMIQLSKSIGIATLLSLSGAVYAQEGLDEDFVPDDRQISITQSNVVDPEFDPVGNRMIWQDQDSQLWLAWIDPDTGYLIPADGKGLLLDDEVAPVYQQLVEEDYVFRNGPEFAYGSGKTYIVYTDLVKTRRSETWALAIASRNFDGEWQTELLDKGNNRIYPIGTGPGQGTDLGRIAYYGVLGNTALVGWRVIEDENAVTEHFIPATGDPFGYRWLEDGYRIIFTQEFEGVRQIALYNTETQTVTQLTYDEGEKGSSFAFSAPEFGGETVLSTVIDDSEIAVYRKINGQWTKTYSQLSPDEEQPFISSPEPFAHNGRYYLSYATHRGNLTDGTRREGPSKIWISSIDADAPLVRLVSNPDSETNKRDPESFPTSQGPVIYYTELVSPYVRYKILRMAKTGL